MSFLVPFFDNKFRIARVGSWVPICRAHPLLSSTHVITIELPTRRGGKTHFHVASRRCCCNLISAHATADRHRRRRSWLRSFVVTRTLLEEDHIYILYIHTLTLLARSSHIYYSSPSCLEPIIFYFRLVLLFFTVIACSNSIFTFFFFFFFYCFVRELDVEPASSPVQPILLLLFTSRDNEWKKRIRAQWGRKKY